MLFFRLLRAITITSRPIQQNVDFSSTYLKDHFIIESFILFIMVFKNLALHCKKRNFSPVRAIILTANYPTNLNYKNEGLIVWKNISSIEFFFKLLWMLDKNCKKASCLPFKCNTFDRKETFGFSSSWRRSNLFSSIPCDFDSTPMLKNRKAARVLAWSISTQFSKNIPSRCLWPNLVIIRLKKI